MPFTAALSTARSPAQALAEVCEQVGAGERAGADSPSFDLVMAFYSPHHLDEITDLHQQLHSRLRPAALLGCVGEAIIGNDREVEDGPALAVWAATWKSSSSSSGPPVQLTTFHLTVERTGDGRSMFGWPDALWDLPAPAAQAAGGAAAAAEPFAPGRAAVLVLGDPHTFPTEDFLTRMNEEAPGVPVQGGMASGVSRPGQGRLMQDGQLRDRGAVGVLLQGERVGLRSIVSQGCRPIGHPMVITRARDNVILELGGQTPYDQLRDLWPRLTAREQELFQQGLHIGRVLNEYQSEFQRGDFLIRNVAGLERQTGALIVGERVRVGQTVQLQVRDAESADEDLRALLQLDLHAHERRPAAALVFSCNGRGTRLFPGPSHDAQAIRQEAGPIPLAGFFAMGELGPVGGQNFIHGYTASVALFDED